MKKIFILLASWLICVVFTNAQITIQKSHLVQQSSVLVQATDTTTAAITIATAGANKTWDFTGLKVGSKETWKFSNSSWLEGFQYCPASNIGYKEMGFDTNNSFLSITNSELRYLGSYNYKPDDTSFSPFNYRLLNLPATYNSTFDHDSSKNPQDASPVGVDMDGTGPLPVIDSLRPIVNLYTSSVIDGYGTVKTPLGTFPCLKQTLTQISRLDMEIYLGGGWQLAPQELLDSIQFPNAWDTAYTHAWWTDDATVGFPLVQYTFQRGDTKASDVEWLQTKPQPAWIGKLDGSMRATFFPNPATGTMHILLNGEVRNADLEIYNLQGEKCLAMCVFDKQDIALDKLANGVYLVVFHYNGTTLAPQKLLKN